MRYCAVSNKIDVKDSVEWINTDEFKLYGFTKICIGECIYYVALDGEVLNIEDIKDKYDIHDDFIEDVLAKCFHRFSLGFIRELRGAFSLIICNGKELFAIKDQLGLRPIYYKDSSDIVLSNSFKTIFELTKEKAIVGNNELCEILSLAPSMNPFRTFFKGFKQIMMGHYLELRASIKIVKYYEIETKKHTDDYDTTILKIKELLNNSLEYNLNGCDSSFLSGGLDSSILVSLSKDKKPMKTYSLEYEGNSEYFNGNMYQVSLDSGFIKIMHDYANTKHTALEIKQEELVNLLDDALRAREFPGMGDIDSSLLWLCDKLKDSKYILSGECSDEIFGGYPWFYREDLKDLNTFPWIKNLDERIELLNDKYKSLDIKNNISESYLRTVNEVKYLSSDDYDDKLMRKNTQLCLNWFMQTLVTRQVMMGDYHNVVIRAPFADVELFEYVYNIPWSMKYYNKDEKGILREAFKDMLPDEICRRKKNPFPKTHNPEFATLIAEKLQSRLNSSKCVVNKIFDKNKLNDLIASKGSSLTQPWFGQLMSGPQLLAFIYQLDLWFEIFNIELE